MVNIKKHISIDGWHIYQSRNDKKMPWCKLWGIIFNREWWQNLPDNQKVVPFILLDVAREYENKCPENYEFFRRNFNLSYSKDEWILICNILKDNGFLSDLPTSYTTDIREEKRREEKRGSPASPPSSEKEALIHKLSTICTKIQHHFPNIHLFLAHLKKHRGEYPPIQVTIKVLESAYKHKPEAWWPYLVMAFRKEIPSHYANLSMKMGEKYKKELEESAGHVLRSVMERVK